MAAVLTVIGATGAQGSSVIESALKSGAYKIRGITRNAESPKAKALSVRGVEIVVADLNDEESLVKAFHGSTAIYAVTDFFEPFARGGPEEAMKVEVAQGKNLAIAAVRTPSLKHYIWSTLPNAMKISNGEFLVPHFEAKNKIDDYIKSKPELVAKTTFLWVTWYASNYDFPMFTPNFLETSGKYLHLQPVVPTVPILTIGDARQNVGLFTSAILAKPEITVGGKFVLASTEGTTLGELLQKWTKATGKPSVYAQVTSLETFDAVFPMWGHEMGIMMQFWEKFGDQSWSGEDLLTRQDLGLNEGFIGLEDSLRNIYGST